MIKIICDRCQREMSKNANRIFYVTVNVMDNAQLKSVPENGNEISKDICDDCLKEVIKVCNPIPIC